MMLQCLENGHLDGNKWTSVRRNGLVWLILIVGGLVRALGALHDLPYTYFGDEEHFIRRSVAFGSGDFNPHWFHKPAFYMYWLFVEYGLYFVVGKLFGWFGSVSDFAQHFFTTMEPFILIGRLTTVAFSVATMYLTYRIGTQYINRRVGLLAAFFLALCVGNFSSSVVVKADVPATFFAMLSLFFIFSLYQKQRWQDYLWAGLFAGIGTATKYYPLTMLVPIFVAHVLTHWEKPVSFSKIFTSSKMMGALLAWGAGFFLGSPYNFLDPTWIRQKWSFVQKLHTVGTINKETGFVTHTSGDLLEKLWSIVIAFKDLGGVILNHSAMGLLVGSLALVGLLFFLVNGIKSGNRKGLICFAYVISFALVVSVYRPSYASSRHLNMLFPILCIAAATATDLGWSRFLLNVRSQKWKKTCMLLVSFFLVFPSAFLIVRYDVRVSQKDTRLVAKEWIETHIPAQKKILLDEKGPKLQWSRNKLEEFYHLAKQEAKVGPFTTHLETLYRYRLKTIEEPAYEITEIYHPWWLLREVEDGVRRLETEKDRDMGNPLKARGVMPLEYYQRQGFEYIVTNSDSYGMYIDTPRQNTFPSIYQFYQDLFNSGKLVKEFKPDLWWRSGPTVRIYRINGQ